MRSTYLWHAYCERPLLSVATDMLVAGMVGGFAKLTLDSFNVHLASSPDSFATPARVAAVCALLAPALSGELEFRSPASRTSDRPLTEEAEAEESEDEEEHCDGEDAEPELKEDNVEESTEHVVVKGKDSRGPCRC